MSEDPSPILLKEALSLSHRRNMWRFFGYSVSLALIKEQDFSLEFLEALTEASRRSDIVLIAVDGSERFANAMTSFHAVDGVFNIDTFPNWRAECAPDFILKGDFFEDPGTLASASTLKL
jgi:uncharacterized SAM-dependent methyltransferase